MAFFKIKADGKVYQIDKLTLGDGQVLKHEFGLADLANFSATDPDVLVGLLALAISKSEGKTLTDATFEARNFDFEGIEQAEDESEVTAESPLDQGDVAAPAEPIESGNSETTLETTGSQS